MFLTIGDYNMDELLESFFHLVYYQVSGEPGIAGCSCRSEIYLGGGGGGGGLARANFFIDRRCVSLFFTC